MPAQVSTGGVHGLVFPGAVCDLQWWAAEDCRPLGKPQLCRGNSAPNSALNVSGRCGLGH